MHDINVVNKKLYLRVSHSTQLLKNTSLVSVRHGYAATIYCR